MLCYVYICICFEYLYVLHICIFSFWAAHNVLLLDTLSKVLNCIFLVGLLVLAPLSPIK